MYPLLAGVFLNSTQLIQAILIPVFFVYRAAFEYCADAITAHTFGSDGMPLVVRFHFDRANASQSDFTLIHTELFWCFNARNMSHCDDLEDQTPIGIFCIDIQ